MALPNFNKPFTIEYDALGKGIGVVLVQNQHPHSYIGKSLSPRPQALSVYERELMAIVYAVHKRGSYLSRAPFLIKIDQKSTKHILEQKLNTPFQHVWVYKLMGFEFEIVYKEWISNKDVDALSRKPDAELLS